MVTVALSPSPSGDGLYALEEQLAVVASCSNPNRPYLVGKNNETMRYALYRPDCGKWDCEYCGRQNRNAWVHKIAYGVQVYIDAGEKWSFATLTANRWRRGFGKSLTDWRHHWPVLYRRIKRYAHPGLLHFAMFPEQHKDKTIHMHVLWSVRFPGKQVVRKKDGSVYFRSPWLAENCNSVGLGYIHDNRPLDSAVMAASYATKYITKSLGVEGWPDYLRRARTSQHWPAHDDHGPVSGMDWSTHMIWETARDHLLALAELGYTDTGSHSR